MTSATDSTQPTRPTSGTQPPYRAIALLVAVLAVTLALFSPLRASLTRYLPVRAPSIRTMTTTASPSANGTSPLQITKRPWNGRGHADHGWLYSFHTFSFASYYSPQHESFGPLRVINEDRVAKGTGFGTHSHAEFLIWSYIVRGVLEHKDSLGNLENLKRGEVQFTSAGTGIQHSEYNRNRDEECHFLQIWAKPSKRGLKPHYRTRKFTDEMKADRFVRIMESEERNGDKDGETDPIALAADLSMDASILTPGKTVEHEIVAEGERNVYLHVVMGGRSQPKAGGAKIKVGDVELGEGDGAYIRGAKGPGKITVESVGDQPAEFLLFDMGKN